MSIPNSAPLPETLTPSTGGQVDPADLARRAQANFDALALRVGNNSNTTAPAALTALYSGTWAPYTGTAGFSPYYSKKNGIVVMGGAVTNGGNFVAGQTMMTMPAGFRPASTEQFPCIAVGGGPTTGIAIVQVAATGVMQFISGITGGGLANPMTYISLSVIEYGAAA